MIIDGETYFYNYRLQCHVYDNRTVSFFFLINFFFFQFVPISRQLPGAAAQQAVLLYDSHALIPTTPPDRSRGLFPETTRVGLPSPKAIPPNMFSSPLGRKSRRRVNKPVQLSQLRGECARRTTRRRHNRHRRRHSPSPGMNAMNGNFAPR